MATVHPLTAAAQAFSPADPPIVGQGFVAGIIEATRHTEAEKWAGRLRSCEAEFAQVLGRMRDLTDMNEELVKQLAEVQAQLAAQDTA